MKTFELAVAAEITEAAEKAYIVGVNYVRIGFAEETLSRSPSYMEHALRGMRESGLWSGKTKKIVFGSEDIINNLSKKIQTEYSDFQIAGAYVSEKQYTSCFRSRLLSEGFLAVSHKKKETKLIIKATHELDENGFEMHTVALDASFFFDRKIHSKTKPEKALKKLGWHASYSLSGDDKSKIRIWCSRYNLVEALDTLMPAIEVLADFAIVTDAKIEFPAMESGQLAAAIRHRGSITANDILNGKMFLEC